MKALVALVDENGSLLGSGFVCAKGLVATCAHVIDKNHPAESPKREVTARFDVGANRKNMTLRLAPGGWFPRRAPARIDDECDALCDIALLEPVEEDVELPEHLHVARTNPDQGSVSVTGYYQNGGIVPETIVSTLQPGGIHPGWLMAKPDMASKDAPVGGMSGAPALLGPPHGETVVGMLTTGQASGRGVALLVPATALRQAINAVTQRSPVGVPTPQPSLWVDEITATYADARFASAYVYAPRQDSRPGEGVRLRGGATFGDPPRNGEPSLRRVEIRLELPDRLGVESMIGNPDPQPFANGVEIHFRGPSLKQPSWTISAGAAVPSLHGHNVAMEDVPLCTIPDAAAGQTVTLRMVAFANKDFAPGKLHLAKAASRARQSIMDRLTLAEIGEPAGNGEITLCVSVNRIEDVAG